MDNLYTLFTYNLKMALYTKPKRAAVAVIFNRNK
jgi:hypothetical protein